MSGIGESFKDFGLGLVGGAVFLLAYRIFGGLGVLAAPLLAGSVLKGDRGKTIAVMAGFMLIALAAFAGQSASSSSNGANNSVM